MIYLKMTVCKVYKKVICRKPAVNHRGKGVAKWAEYYVSEAGENTFYVYDEECKNTMEEFQFFIGVFPIKNFITLAEFRNKRIEDIFKD